MQNCEVTINEAHSPKFFGEMPIDSDSRGEDPENYEGIIGPWAEQKILIHKIYKVLELGLVSKNNIAGKS